MTPTTLLYPGPTAENLASIPAELMALPQWVLWRGEDKVDPKTRDRRLNKKPINPQGLYGASTTDPATWGTFEWCVAALATALEEWELEDPTAYRGGGLGFVFTPHDPFVGIDLDYCVDETTGIIAPWAQAHVAGLASYTEITPSTTGLHIVVQGTLPPHGRKKGSIEMYSAGRFFTMTGWHLDETPGTVEPRQSQLSALHTAVFGAPTPPQPPGRRAPSPTLDDDTLLSKARSARNSAKFIRLWAGDTSRHGGDDSVADMALCAELAFWTHDPAQIDRLFRQSGLMRPKWDAIHNTQTHETYGARTIANTLTRQRSQYEAPAAAGLHGFSTLTTQLSHGLTPTLRRAL